MSLLALRMVLTLCYDAISRNVSNTSYSPFILFTVTSSTILPSCCVILLLMDRVGRKAIVSFSLLFTGLFIGAAGVILVSQGDNTSEYAATGCTRCRCVPRWSANSHHSLELEYSLPQSQQPANSLYSKLKKCSPHSVTHFFKIHFNIIILFKRKSSKRLIPSCLRIIALHAFFLLPSHSKCSASFPSEL